MLYILGGYPGDWHYIPGVSTLLGEQTITRTAMDVYSYCLSSLPDISGRSDPSTVSLVHAYTHRRHRPRSVLDTQHCLIIRQLSDL